MSASLHDDDFSSTTYLMTAEEGLAASYRYDAYGNLAGSSGILAVANGYRFSSKEVHLNSGLYYYGYRFYSPNWQRWPNRDPLGDIGFMMLNNAAEHGLPFDLDSQPTSNLAGVGEESLENTQLNLYRFVGNNPVNYADPLGLAYKSCVLLEQTCTSSKNVRIRSGLFWVTVTTQMQVAVLSRDPNTCFNIPCKNRACHEGKDHGVIAGGK